jgi:dTDP-4-dehydrorhamnose reductase
MTPFPFRRVWVTGAGGLIGSYVCAAAAACAPGAEVTGITRDVLDLSDAFAVARAFREQQPELVIHCAAVSKPALCEEDPALAQRINVEMTARLAALAEQGALIFFSTDVVFDGREGGYAETAPTNPLSVYARTKVAAEKTVLLNPRHTVVRTSLTGGRSPTGDRAFNEEMRRAWAAGRRLRLFADEYRNPLPAQVTARAVWALAEQRAAGLFHLAGAEKLSRWEIGQQVAARCPELNPQLEPGSLREYAGPPRAPDTSLNCARIQALLPFPLPGLTEWLRAHPEEFF